MSRALRDKANLQGKVGLRSWKCPVEMRTSRSRAELDLGKVPMATDAVDGSVKGRGRCEGRRVEVKGDLGMGPP